MNSYGLRLFVQYYQDAVHALGDSPEVVIELRDMAEKHCFTRGDIVSLAVLDDSICEFYGITEEGFDEWR